MSKTLCAAGGLLLSLALASGATVEQGAYLATRAAGLVQ